MLVTKRLFLVERGALCTSSLCAAFRPPARSFFSCSHPSRRRSRTPGNLAGACRRRRIPGRCHAGRLHAGHGHHRLRCSVPGLSLCRVGGDIVTSGSPLSFAITGDTSLTAVFEAVEEPTRSLKCTPSSSRRTSGTSCAIRAGSLRTRRPGHALRRPNRRLRLRGWSGDVPEGTDPHDSELSLTMDADVEITAGFERPPRSRPMPPLPTARPVVPSACSSGR